MIQAVIFDIDNTLYSYDNAHETAFSALLDYVEEKLPLSREQFIRLHKETQKRLKLQMGSVSTIHSRLIRYQNLLEEQGLPIFHAVTMNDLYWDTLVAHSVPTESAEAVMQELKSRGIRIGIGTDMTARRQYLKLRQLGLMEYIDFMVSSEEAQSEKPDPAFFSMCIQKAKCPPENILFVGDSLKKDAMGASACGMKGIWFCPDGATPDQTVTQITQLSQLLSLLS